MKIGGVVLVNDYIWISDSDGNGIFLVRKDYIMLMFFFFNF